MFKRNLWSAAALSFMVSPFAGAEAPTAVWSAALPTSSDVCEFAPDGSILAFGDGFVNCGGKGGTECFGTGGFTLYDAHSGDMIYTLMPFDGAVRDIDFSPDGSLLALAAEFNVVQIRAAVDGALIRQLFLYSGEAWSVEFTEDGQYLLVGLVFGSQGGLLLFRVSDGELLNTFDFTESVPVIALSPDGTLIAVSESEGVPQIQVYEVGNEIPITVITAPHNETGQNFAPIDLDFAPDGLTVAAAGVINVKVFDVNSGATLPALTPPIGDVWSVDVAPDGQSIVSGGFKTQFGYKGTIQFWDATSGALLTEYDQGTGEIVKDAQFAPDGATIAFTAQVPLGAVAEVIDNPLDAPPLLADIDGDGLVGASDLGLMLGDWGPCTVNRLCPCDLTNDAMVDAADLSILLGAWTP